MNRADHHLVQQVLDGDVTQETFSHFQQRLRQEPEFVKLYEDYALLHHTLSEEFEGGHALGLPPLASTHRISGLPMVLVIVVVLAFIVAIGLYRAWNSGERIKRVPADGGSVVKALGSFRSVVSGPFDKTQWRVDFGNPSISGSRIDGENYSAFLRLPETAPGPGDPVLLATLDVGKSTEGEFHTAGWAGMSFFSGGREVLFFGDSYGTAPVWSIDVKQRIPVIVPEHPVKGPGMITLRYDSRTGDVDLHEGGVPLKPAFCSGKIVQGTRFDEIRIGASSGAALAVKSIHIRVGAD